MYPLCKVFGYRMWCTNFILSQNQKILGLDCNIFEYDTVLKGNNLPIVWREREKEPCLKKQQLNSHVTLLGHSLHLCLVFLSTHYARAIDHYFADFYASVYDQRFF